MRLGNSSNTTLLVRLKAQKSQAVFFIFWGLRSIFKQVLFFFSIFLNSFSKNLLIYMLGSVIPSSSHILHWRYTVWLSGGVMECWLWWNFQQQWNLTSGAACKCYRCHILTCIEKAWRAFKAIEIIANVSFGKNISKLAPSLIPFLFSPNSLPLLVEN